MCKYVAVMALGVAMLCGCECMKKKDKDADSSAPKKMSVSGKQCASGQCSKADKAN